MNRPTILPKFSVAKPPYSRVSVAWGRSTLRCILQKQKRCGRPPQYGEGTLICREGRLTPSTDPTFIEEEEEEEEDHAYSISYNATLNAAQLNAEIN